MVGEQIALPFPDSGQTAEEKLMLRALERERENVEWFGSPKKYAVRTDGGGLVKSA